VGTQSAAAANPELAQARNLIWQPQEGPQELFLECMAEDACIGGARGGGKTDALLGDWIAHVGRHGKNAQGILFRKTYVELVEVIGRSRELFARLGWSYQEQSHRWSVPGGGTLDFAYLETDADADVYQGREYTWMGFDELGNWPSPVAIDRLWGCLRSKHGVPCVRRSTCNPGGPGHAWVKKRYISHGAGKIFAWAPNEKRPDLTIRSVFIPSRLDDNPLLMQNDPHYESRLAAAGGEALFRAWRYGDWDAQAGTYFDVFDPKVHVVQQPWLEPWYPRWIGMDWGFKDQSVAIWKAQDENKQVTSYRELTRNGLTPTELGEALVEANDGDEIGVFYLSPDAFAKRTSQRTIADEIGAVLTANGMPAPTRADDSRVSGWSLMYQMLKSGFWKIGAACPNLIESLPLLIRDDKHPEDCAAHPNDHAPDAARYALATYMHSAQEPVEVQIRRRVNAPEDQPTDRMLQLLKAQHDLNKPAQYRPNKRRYF
jgi:hypothetical protein